MHKRFLATTVLALALLFSQGGSFLVAALCPHLRSGVMSCAIQVPPSETSHHDMDHMQMDSLKKESRPPQDDNAVALGEPMGSCTHCSVHSRTTPNAVSLRESDVPQRSGDRALTVPASSVLPVAISPAAVPASRAHGPPGEHISRHILISIFRI